jgi:hypothetical protein
LSEGERARILAVLDSPGFADKSPGQVYAILLDRGVYLCSEASMYRLLRERGQSGERRAQATHPAKKKPELMADGPDQVWSWDITKLKGPARGIWYLEGYSGDRFVTRSLFPIAPCRHNKDDLFMKGFSYHTTSEEQAIACIIPPGSTVKKSSTSASGSILRNVGQ